MLVMSRRCAASTLDAARENFKETYGTFTTRLWRNQTWFNGAKGGGDHGDLNKQ